MSVVGIPTFLDAIAISLVKRSNALMGQGAVNVLRARARENKEATSTYSWQAKSARAKLRKFRLLPVPDRMRAPLRPVTPAVATDVRN